MRISMRIACLVVAIVYAAGFDFSLAFAEEFRYDSHGKRDPFVSPSDALLVGGHQMGHGELRIEGVIIDPKGDSYAIVNGQIVKEGDLFEGFTLKKVEPNQVTFEKDAEKFDIVLHEDDEALKGSEKTGKSGN